MYYGEIKKIDIANGLGVRVSLFVSGCRNHCPGCFNAATWNFDYGKPFTEDTEREILEALKPSHIKGLTVLGGEPFEEENQRVLAPPLIRKKTSGAIRDMCTIKTFVPMTAVSTVKLPTECLPALTFLWTDLLSRPKRT